MASDHPCRSLKVRVSIHTYVFQFQPPHMCYTDRLTCSVTSSEMYFNAGDSVMTLFDRVCAHILAVPSSVETCRFHRSGQSSPPCRDRIPTDTQERNSSRLYDSSDGRLLLDIPNSASSAYNTSLADQQRSSHPTLVK